MTSSPTEGKASDSGQANTYPVDRISELQMSEKRGFNFYSFGKHSLPHHAILHWLRTRLECYHRERIANKGSHPYGIYRPHLDIDGPEGFLPMCSGLDQDGDCCNKTAAFYVLTDAEDVPHLFYTILHNWLYMKWFRPYQSEIDFCQFIAKTICPKPIPGLDRIPRQDLFSKVIKLHNRVCQQVEEYRERLAHPDTSDLIPEHLSQLQPDEHELFLLLPTFRAVIVVVDSRRHDLSSSTSDLGDMPAHLILTGTTEGLSAPVSFDDFIPSNAMTERVSPPQGESWSAVQTSLGEAFRFLRLLEQREVGVFGLQPDPAKFPFIGRLQQEVFSCLGMDKRLAFEEHAVRLGWRGGDVALRMPSSTWTDLSLYKDWFGWGADFHYRVMLGHEEFLRRAYLACRRMREEE